MSDYKDFFGRFVNYPVQSMIDEGNGHFEIEELYQAFKAGLIDELVAIQPNVSVDDIEKGRTIIVRPSVTYEIVDKQQTGSEWV